MIDAAKRLIAKNGTRFTTQELVKEAGVATKTFYRHFTGKDELILAVLEDMIANQAEKYEEVVATIPDPVARLHHHITAPLLSLGGAEERGWELARFVTSEHLRLSQSYPEEIAQVTRPFRDIVVRDVRAARDAGLLAPADVERDAALVSRLVVSVYHDHVFARSTEPVEAVAESLWVFCLTALGGRALGGRAGVGRPGAGHEPHPTSEAS